MAHSIAQHPVPAVTGLDRAHGTRPRQLRLGLAHLAFGLVATSIAPMWVLLLAPLLFGDGPFVRFNLARSLRNPFRPRRRYRRSAPSFRHSTARVPRSSTKKPLSS